MMPDKEFPINFCSYRSALASRGVTVMRVFWWVTGTYVFATFIPFHEALPIATRGFSTFTSGIAGPNVSGAYINSVTPAPYAYRRSPYGYGGYAGGGRSAYYPRRAVYYPQDRYIRTGQYDYGNFGDTGDFQPFECNQGWRGPDSPC